MLFHYTQQVFGGSEVKHKAHTQSEISLGKEERQGELWRGLAGLSLDLLKDDQDKLPQPLPAACCTNCPNRPLFGF